MTFLTFIAAFIVVVVFNIWMSKKGPLFPKKESFPDSEKPSESSTSTEDFKTIKEADQDEDYFSSEDLSPLDELGTLYRM